MSESVYCHDCRAAVDIDPAIVARAPACPRCAGAFLEILPHTTLPRPDAEPFRELARAIRALLDPSMRAGGVFLGDDIDFTQFDTRNFDAPAAEGTLEALPERACERDGGATCSVCLTDFARGETVKVLPCDHGFHAPCLGEWLKLVRRRRRRRRLLSL